MKRILPLLLLLINGPVAFVYGADNTLPPPEEENGFVYFTAQQASADPAAKKVNLQGDVTITQHTQDGQERIAVGEDITLDQLNTTVSSVGPMTVTAESGKLEGIITDGDLRRCMSADIMGKKASDVMTKNPKIIAPDVMAVEALNMMNNTGKGITQLFVLDDDKKPIGIIHIHDCLRAGVA